MLGWVTQIRGPSASFVMCCLSVDGVGRSVSSSVRHSVRTNFAIRHPASSQIVAHCLSHCDNQEIMGSSNLTVTVNTDVGMSPLEATEAANKIWLAASCQSDLEEVERLYRWALSAKRPRKLLMVEIEALPVAMWNRSKRKQSLDTVD